jgi:hypothetical protein
MGGAILLIGKARNQLFAVFALLIIWIIKLSLPQHMFLSIYSSQSSQLPAILAPSVPVETPQDTPVLGLNITATNKVAAIIETRFHTSLIPLILHFSTVLGPTWPIFIYTSAELAGQFSASAALSRYLQAGTFQIRLLPQTVQFTKRGVNDFLTKPWLWESLAPAEHILIFQSDSMICANAGKSVEDYFEYDFVGAPIAKGLGEGYNGGLSLRKRSTIIQILENWEWNETTTKNTHDEWEDQWYYHRFVYSLALLI